MDKTTIQVSADVTTYLEAQKMANESYNEVLRRELGLLPDDEIADLTAYLSDDRAAEVRDAVEWFTEQFDVEMKYQEHGGTGGNPRLNFCHPESGVPVAAIETSPDSGKYMIEYYRHNDKRQGFVDWNNNDRFDKDDEERLKELYRLVRGAYRSA